MAKILDCNFLPEYPGMLILNPGQNVNMLFFNVLLKQVVPHTWFMPMFRPSSALDTCVFLHLVSVGTTLGGNTNHFDAVEKKKQPSHSFLILNCFNN